MKPKASSTHLPPSLMKPPLTGMKTDISAMQLLTKLKKRAYMVKPMSKLAGPPSMRPYPIETKRAVPILPPIQCSLSIHASSFRLAWEVLTNSDKLDLSIRQISLQVVDIALDFAIGIDISVCRNIFCINGSSDSTGFLVTRIRAELEAIGIFARRHYCPCQGACLLARKRFSVRGKE